MDYREPTTAEAIRRLVPEATFSLAGERIADWRGPGQPPGRGAIAAARRNLAAERIVAAAEAALASFRAVIFTADPAQAAIYLEKEKEALAYIAAGYPDPVDATLYPILAVEAPARGLTPTEQADAVVAKAAEWRAIAAACEGARRALLDVDGPVSAEPEAPLRTAAQMSAAADAVLASVFALVAPKA